MYVSRFFFCLFCEFVRFVFFWQVENISTHDSQVPSRKSDIGLMCRGLEAEPPVLKNFASLYKINVISAYFDKN